MKNIEWKKSSIDYDKLNQLTHQKVVASEISSNRIVDKTTREKLSKALSGKPKSKSHIEKLKTTKLKYKITKEQILEAQIGTNFAKEVADKLGIDGHTYKDIATYHGVYDKKRDGNRLAQSKSTIHVWYYDKTKSDSKGEWFGSFISKSQAAEACGIKMRIGITKVIKGEFKQMGGFFFEEYFI